MNIIVTILIYGIFLYILTIINLEYITDDKMKTKYLIISIFLSIIIYMINIFYDKISIK